MLWGDDFVDYGSRAGGALRRSVDARVRAVWGVYSRVHAPRGEWNHYGMMIAHEQIDDAFRVKSIVEAAYRQVAHIDLAKVKGCILSPEIFEDSGHATARKGE